MGWQRFLNMVKVHEMDGNKKQPSTNQVEGFTLPPDRHTDTNGRNKKGKRGR